MKTLVLALVLAFCLVSGAAANEDAFQLSVTLVPTAPESDEPPNLSYFRYDLAGGGSREDRILLKNLGEQPLVLAIYAADGLNTPDGGLTGPLLGETNSGVGNWIHVSDSQVTLAPDEEKQVTVRMTIPGGTPTGDHFGFVFIQSVKEPTSVPVESNQASFAVRLQTRYGITLWERVPGEQKVDFMMQPPRKKIEKGQLQLVVEMDNPGTLFLKPEASWRLTGPDGGVILSRDMGELGYLLPGSALSQVIPVITSRPLVRGTYRLEVDARYGAFGEDKRSQRKTFEIELP